MIRRCWVGIRMLKTFGSRLTYFASGNFPGLLVRTGDIFKTLSGKKT
jgi:hypothetical protein